MHLSIAKQDTIEFIEQTQVSPLVTKGVAKVFYVGDNRNGTSISKETAMEMGRKLPGSPVVGYYREDLQDFEEHSRKIEITTDKFEILDLTKPYGFVPTDSKIWFQTFTDDGVDHEYLCCEVYIWTTAYPESQRVFDKGNNQSMELNNDSIGGAWTKRANSQHEIFIINEALIEKLCILGEDFEPCFEGASVQAQFALQFNKEIEQLKTSLFSLMNEVKDALNDEGGAKMEFTTYAVELGDTLWCAIYDYLENTYPRENEAGSIYGLRGIYEEGAQKFAILQNREDNNLFRMDFSWEEDSLTASEELQEVVTDYVSEETYAFSMEDNDNYKKNDEKEEDNSDKEDNPDSDNDTEENEEEDDPEDEDDDAKKSYSLDEIPEYVELNEKYSAVVEERDRLNQQISDLTAQLESLKEFKLKAERVEKEAKIAEFFMLSDDDKAEVINNIDNYSVEEIEAKLSVICFHNKVSFADPSEEEEKDGNNPIPTNFSLQGLEDNDSAPEWVKAVRLAQSERDC